VRWERLFQFNNISCSVHLVMPELLFNHKEHGCYCVVYKLLYRLLQFIEASIIIHLLLQRTTHESSCQTDFCLTDIR
jgi:hypothetical protein